MPLTVVAEVVAHGGSLPQLEQLGKKKKFFTKKNGVVVGLFWFIFFTMFCTAFFGIVNAPDELVALCAITGVFGSMMIILASLIFLPSSKIKFPFTMPVAAPPQGLYGQPQQGALPPQQSQPANQYRPPGAGSWRDTNDLQPTSVTESTTRLLSDEERPR
jgi:hypothetical protein